MTDEKKAQEGELRWLIGYLCDERGLELDRAAIASEGAEELFQTFRALVNTREPVHATDEFYARQDALLRGLITEKGITRATGLPRTPNDRRISLWRGDITTLAADAIVNAANDQMLGCWVPGHTCIDNAIHTFAGVQLREECARIMGAQGHAEPTGKAKVTGAYNLPARRVIHTVGPIAQGRPTPQHEAQLAWCYTSCLDAAVGAGCCSIAFCCISTGVFGFPQDKAARIAVRTVRTWLDAHPSDAPHVIFNVFGAKDEEIYHGILG